MSFVRLVLGLTCAAAAGAAELPRLAVVISVDQMRGDYLDRFGPYFGPDGFNRLRAGGAHFSNCHYQHAYTVTAPGHATILSGVNANVHGIIGNDWVDRSTFLKGNAVEDRSSPLVGLPPRRDRYRNPQAAAQAGRSPANYLGTTVGDRLKARFGSAAKVFGVADKDRSAILMGGKQADGAYWTEEGVFVTSTYYRRELPAWAGEFNASRNATAYFGQTWDRLLPVELYDRVQGPDDAPGEDKPVGLPITFPKRVSGTGKAPSGDYFSAFDRTPWNNTLVAAFARRLIEAEELGQDDTTDLIAIGFSQPDAAGHTYGPDSHEIFDSYLRLDREIADLLRFLEARVGAGRFLVVLTADHGISPLPERVLSLDPAASAGRVSLAEIDAAVNRELEQEFGSLPDGGVWFLRDGGFFVNAAALKAKQLTSSAVEPVIKRALLRVPWLGSAHTRSELTSAEPLDPVAEMARRSYHAERSPDVVFYLRRYFTTNKAGISHGTPYDYDTHVPLLWYGAGIAPGVNGERVGPENLAPTLAGLLGLDLPAARGRRLF